MPCRQKLIALVTFFKKGKISVLAAVLLLHPHLGSVFVRYRNRQTGLLIARAGLRWHLHSKLWASLWKTRSPAVAREDALQLIAAPVPVHSAPSMPSKISDVLVMKGLGLCDFLLVINSNLGLICHRFRDRTYRLATIAHSDLQHHPSSMIFILSEKAYATSY